MTPEPGNAHEVEGVLNPGSGQADGEVFLFPRLVAAGNVSRVGRARVVIENGIPVGVERDGIVLEPERAFESGVGHSGVEDPRITRIDAPRLWVMTYVAYGPLGPRTALAVSADLREWRRLGPAHLRLRRRDGDRPQPVPQQGHAVLPRAGHSTPTGSSRSRCCTGRCGTWTRSPPGRARIRRQGSIRGRASGSPSCDSTTRCAMSRALTHWTGSRLVAAPEHPFEQVKVGGGPPPLRVPEGWLLLHHGVTGKLEREFSQQQNVNYAAGGMILRRGPPVGGRRAHQRTAAAGRDRGRAQRHRAERRLPDRDRGDRRRAVGLLRHGRLEDRRRPVGSHPMIE